MGPRRPTLLAAALVSFGGCHLLGGVTDLVYVDEAPAGSSSSSGGATSVGGAAGAGGADGSGGDGGAVACTSAEQCEGEEGPCAAPSCEGSRCGTSYEPAGEPCGTGMVCDGRGACVAVGNPCDTPSECPTGYCTDGVCCLDACAGPCAACDTGEIVGVCTPHTAGTTPEGSCAGTCDGAGNCSNPTVEWAKRLGASGEQHAVGIATDDSGNIYVLAQFKTSIQIDATTVSAKGNDDILVAKLAPTGGLTWAKGFGAAGGSAFAGGIAVTPAGEACVVGSFEGNIDVGSGATASAGLSDVFVLKLEPDGDIDWGATFGDGANQEGLAIALDDAGALLLGGRLDGTVGFGGADLVAAGGGDAFVVKLTDSGAHVFSRAFGDAELQAARAVASDGDETLLYGDFAGTIEATVATLNSMGGQDPFLLRLDASGTVVAASAWGDAGEQLASRAAARTGAVVLTGRFDGVIDFGGSSLDGPGSDFFVAGLEDDGTHVFSAAYGEDTTVDAPRALALDPWGNVLVGGSYVGMLNLGGGTFTGNLENAFLAKYAANGTFLYAGSFGASDDQSARALAADAQGHLCVAGSFRQQIVLGTTTLNTLGGNDGFVARLTP